MFSSEEVGLARVGRVSRLMSPCQGGAGRLGLDPTGLIVSVSASVVMVSVVVWAVMMHCSQGLADLYLATYGNGADGFGLAALFPQTHAPLGA
jgi:hypothetical protein